MRNVKIYIYIYEYDGADGEVNFFLVDKTVLWKIPVVNKRPLIVELITLFVSIVCCFQREIGKSIFYRAGGYSLLEMISKFQICAGLLGELFFVT